MNSKTMHTQIFDHTSKEYKHIQDILENKKNHSFNESWCNSLTNDSYVQLHIFAGLFSIALSHNCNN
jgi:hypothetical protein